VIVMEHKCQYPHDTKPQSPEENAESELKLKQQVEYPS